MGECGSSVQARVTAQVGADLSMSSDTDTSKYLVWVFFSERACIHNKSQVKFLQNKAADGPSADPAASLHLNPLFLFPPFQALP